MSTFSKTNKTGSSQNSHLKTAKLPKLANKFPTLPKIPNAPNTNATVGRRGHVGVRIHHHQYIQWREIFVSRLMTSIEPCTKPRRSWVPSFQNKCMNCLQIFPNQSMWQFQLKSWKRPQDYWQNGLVSPSIPSCISYQEWIQLGQQQETSVLPSSCRSSVNCPSIEPSLECVTISSTQVGVHHERP